MKDNLLMITYANVLTLPLMGNISEVSGIRICALYHAANSALLDRVPSTTLLASPGPPLIIIPPPMLDDIPDTDDIFSPWP